MASAVLVEQAKNEDWTDEQVVGRVLAGETALFELLMRRHNRRLYRVARAILRDDAEAEDVMQDAYVRAYQNLASFEGRAKFATWLTRIAVHEALARCRKRSRFQSLDNSDPSNGDLMNAAISLDRSPEEETYDRDQQPVVARARPANSACEDQCAKNQRSKHETDAGECEWWKIGQAELDEEPRRSPDTAEDQPDDARFHLVSCT